MLREVDTQIEIDAPPDRVWEVLTDFDALPEWNPVLTQIRGTLAVGSWLRVQIVVMGRRLPLLVRLSKVDPGRAFEWWGGVPFVFRGHHGFRVEDLGNGRSRLVHYERFDGGAVRFLGATIDRLRDDYVRMNEALKARAES